VNAHLNIATPNFFLQESFDDFNEAWCSDVLTHPFRVHQGWIRVAEDRPGWGTDLNYEHMAKYPYNPAHMLSLFRDGWEKREGTRLS
jgi:galactonate dehydratase